MSNPINLNECRRAYNNDLTYTNFVNIMYQYIDKLAMTPAEVRQACMFACYLHEIRKPLEFTMTKEETDKFFGR